MMDQQSILCLCTLKKLGISMDELMDNRLMIQDFNQSGQRVIGKLNINLKNDQMKSSMIFYAIDVTTTYNLLLERP